MINHRLHPCGRRLGCVSGLGGLRVNLNLPFRQFGIEIVLGPGRFGFRGRGGRRFWRRRSDGRSGRWRWYAGCNGGSGRWRLRPTAFDVRQQATEQADQHQRDDQQTVAARPLAALSGCGGLVIAATAHMTSGAETPNSFKPFLMTCRVARLRLSRTSRNASSGTRTRCSL